MITTIIVDDHPMVRDGPESLPGLLRYAVGRLPHWAGKVSVESTGTEPERARSLGGRFLMIVQEAVGNALVRGRVIFGIMLP